MKLQKSSSERTLVAWSENTCGMFGIRASFSRESLQSRDPSPPGLWELSVAVGIPPGISRVGERVGRFHSFHSPRREADNRVAPSSAKRGTSSTPALNHLLSDFFGGGTLAGWAGRAASQGASWMAPHQEGVSSAITCALMFYCLFERVK